MDEEKITQDLPPTAVSLKSTLGNKTGSWSLVKPFYENKVPPCNGACPAGENVEGWLKLCKEGKIEEAWRFLVRDNPFPAICGIVCHHPCEAVCSRKMFDGEVEINNLERLLGLRGLDWQLDSCVNDATPLKKIMVVGAGPAGLSCAYQLRKRGHDATVFEALPQAGGMLRAGIPEHRLDRFVLDKEIERLINFGVKIIPDSRVRKENFLSSLKKSDFDAFFVATGCHKSRKLNIKGEDLPGVMPGLKFLKIYNFGLSTAEAVRNLRVAVIGGGNTAIDASRLAARLGAKEVRIIYRRKYDHMPALKTEVELARDENVKFENQLTAPVEIFPPSEGRPLVMDCCRMEEFSEKDETGRNKVRPVAGSLLEVEADLVLVAIGEEANLSFLPPTGVLSPKEASKIFIGGDALTGPRFVSEAIGSGKTAASLIDNYLKGIAPVENISRPKVLRMSDLNLAYFELQEKWSLELSKATLPETIIFKAKRCFNCGVCTECDNCFRFCPDLAISKIAQMVIPTAMSKTGQENKSYRIDYDYCKGCGICVKECPRGAMSLKGKDEDQG